MRHFFISVLGTIAGIFAAVFLLIFFLIALGAAAAPKAAVATGNILDIDLRLPMTDQSSGGGLFGAGGPAMTDLVRKIDRAKDDDGIKGIFVRANSYGMSPARAQEFRDALIDFKTSGKFVIAHAQGFEGLSPFNYMAVSAADDIWLQDTAGFSIAGVRSEVGFLGGVFEKYDAKADFIQFHEYKNAANAYTQSSLTDAHRESLTEMVGSLYDNAVETIALDRALGTNSDEAAGINLKARQARLNEIFNTAPHSAEFAQTAGLVDTLGHYAAARDHAKREAGEDSDFLPVSSYAVDGGSGPVIALVGGEGTIMTGDSAGGNPFAPAVTMGSDTISEALSAAAKDKKVKAIVFRIDSGGGSAIASDQMWDAVNRAKAAGKPVIVSMGQYAASGGYYAAAPADKIVAQPMTLTGSIGVLGGKIALEDTYAKVGYNVEAVSKGGPFTAAYSGDEPWTPELREKFRASMEDIYVDFTSRVAEGRDLPIERVREIAKGRVWTGAQAKEIGLVDEFGGLMKAIELAKTAAEIDADTDVRIKKFPRPLTTAQQIEQLLGSSVTAGQNLTQISGILQSPDVQALLKAREAALAGSQTAQDRSLMADMPVIR